MRSTGHSCVLAPVIDVSVDHPHSTGPLLRAFRLRFFFCKIYYVHLTNLALSQSIEYFSGTPPYCEPFVDYPVYVPEGYSIDNLSATVQLRWGIQVGDMECQIASWKLACLKSFPRAWTVGNVTMPRQICRSVCQYVVDACADINELEDWMQA
jgi:hypothetical protein